MGKDLARVIDAEYKEETRRYQREMHGDLVFYDLTRDYRYYSDIREGANSDISDAVDDMYRDLYEQDIAIFYERPPLLRFEEYQGVNIHIGHEEKGFSLVFDFEECDETMYNRANHYLTYYRFNPNMTSENLENYKRLFPGGIFYVREAEKHSWHLSENR